MGGGGIEVLKAKLDSILSSLIISLIKIDSFKKYFYLNNTKFIKKLFNFIIILKAQEESFFQ